MGLSGFGLVAGGWRRPEMEAGGTRLDSTVRRRWDGAMDRHIACEDVWPIFAPIIRLTDLGTVLIAMVVDRISQGLGSSARDRGRQAWHRTGPVGLARKIWKGAAKGEPHPSVVASVST
jgi:hypothetical protein